MAGIVGTIVTVKDYLSPKEVKLVVQPKQPNEDKIILNEKRKYIIPAFQREIRWTENNVKILLSDLLNGSRFLGNVILTITSNEECLIIDGQQRTIILKMILGYIKNRYNEQIELFDMCLLENGSFPGFQKLLDNGFNPSAFTTDEWQKMLEEDVYNQYDRFIDIWKALDESEVLNSRNKAGIILQNLKKSEINIIASKSEEEDVSIRYFLDVNLKGVQLDTEDIFKGYLFKQDSSKSTRELWQEIKKLSIKFNTKYNQKKDTLYPLMKIYEHFFYCDLYLPKDSGQNFSDVKFNEKFQLTKQANVDGDTYFEGTHIIDTINNSEYIRKSLLRIESSLKIMIKISTSDAVDTEYRSLFKSDEKIDDVMIKNTFYILKRVLLNREVIPKVLALKYIISFMNGENHTKEEYKSIYSIFSAAVLFTIFAPKKESDTFYELVRNKTWINDINMWLSSYISSHELTRGKLLVAYKYSDEPDEHGKDYQEINCKSLAAIYNFIKIIKDGDIYRVNVKNQQNFYDFISDSKEFSLEHFIIGKGGTLHIKTEKLDYQYSYPSKIKKYRNSLFNYIFIDRDLNGGIANSLLGQKFDTLKQNEKLIKCKYTKKYIELSSNAAYFPSYPRLSNLMPFESEQEATDYLDEYFNKNFLDEFLLFATDLIRSFSLN